MKTLATIAVVAVLATVSACSHDDAPPATASPLESALDSVSAESLRAHLTFLASDELEGRLTGEAGYDKAAAYVVEQFDSAGLKPGGVDGWYQEVPLVAYSIDNDSVQFVAHRDSGDQAFTYRKDFAMYGDIVRPENSVTAEVVYVGYGVHAPEFGYSDYDNVDVRGKVIALFGRAPGVLPHNEMAYYSSTRVKLDEAVRRGAIAAIVLRSRYEDDSYPWARIEASTGTKPGMTWLSEGGEADGYFPEIEVRAMLSPEASERFFAGTPISFDEARDATEASRPASVPLGFEVTLGMRTRQDLITSPNVIGMVRGTDPVLADEYVVYSAHLDHVGRGVAVDGDDIYNGAYDNAMGSSLLIETARVFAASPARRSTLFIALTGEEKGLLGSDYFAHYPTVPIDSIVADINLDMPLFLFPVADLIAFGAEHSSLDGPVRRAAAEEGFTVTPDPMPQEVVFVRSDQFSFVRRGIPSIFLEPGFGSTDASVDGAAAFSDFRHNHYHQPSDDLTRPVHWDSAVRFARANARIGYDVADTDARPTWNEGDFFGEKFGRPSSRK